MGRKRWTARPITGWARTSLHVTFEVPPQPGDALELGWGAKADQREAVLMVNGEAYHGAGRRALGFSLDPRPASRGRQGRPLRHRDQRQAGPAGVPQRSPPHVLRRRPEPVRISAARCTRPSSPRTAVAIRQRPPSRPSRKCARSGTRTSGGLASPVLSDGRSRSRSKASALASPPGREERASGQRGLLPLPPLRRRLAGPGRPGHRADPAQPDREPRFLERPRLRRRQLSLHGADRRHDRPAAVGGPDAGHAAHRDAPDLPPGPAAGRLLVLQERLAAREAGPRRDHLRRRGVREGRPAAHHGMAGPQPVVASA